jgi:hypothetical protein
MKASRWARAYYDQLRAGGKNHHAALRALAFKWQRILFRCWKDHVPYDEARYLASLEKPELPIVGVSAGIACGRAPESSKKVVEKIPTWGLIF